MNFFQKIKFANKISKKIKAVKTYLNSTDIDDELKEILISLKLDIQKLLAKVPEAKAFLADLSDIVK